jgi:hypothetical protein
VLAGDESPPYQVFPVSDVLPSILEHSIPIPYFRGVWKSHYTFCLNLYMVLLKASGAALANF